MIGVLWRQQRQVLPVHADPIEVPEIGVASLLAPDGYEIELAVLLVNAEQLRDIAVAGGDRELLATRLQIVKVEMAPVVALRKPDDLVGRRQVAPVHRAVARSLELSAISSSTSRMAPVAASATRICSCR